MDVCVSERESGWVGVGCMYTGGIVKGGGDGGGRVTILAY